MNIHRTILSLSLALSLLLSPSLARADDAKYMAGFYLAVKGAQLAAISGTADLWEALGNAGKAKELQGLAAGLQRGDLGADVAQEVVKASSAEATEAIKNYQAQGVRFSEPQLAAANRAKLKIAGTTLLWAGALVAAKQTLESDQLDLATKVLLGIAMAAEVAAAGRATKQLISAWSSYSRFVRGGSNFEPPSREMLKFEPLLAKL